MGCMPDVVVVGAGVVGASVGCHLAERGVDVTVVEREHPVAGATARSGGIVSCFGDTAAEASLEWESLTGYFERWGERIGGACGFTRTGEATLAGPEEAAALVAVTAVQRAAGVEVEPVSAAGLAEVEPYAYLGDVRAATGNPMIRLQQKSKIR